MTSTHTLPDLVHPGQVVMLTVVDRSGTTPVFEACPLTAAEVGENTLSFLVDARAPWTHHLGEPTVGLSAVNGTHNTWVSLSGKAEVSDDRARIIQLWSAPAEAYFDGRDDPNVRLLTVNVATGSYWSAPGGGPIGRLVAVIGAAMGRSGGSDHGDLDLPA
jgi:general stress protein 26